MYRDILELEYGQSAWLEEYVGIGLGIGSVRQN